MSSDSMFEPTKEDTPSKVKKLIIIGLVAVFAIAGAAFWYFAPADPKKSRYSDEKLRDSIVLMLAQPKFSGDVFREQILGKARMPWFSIPDKEFYFSLPEMSEEEFNASIDRFIDDKTKIEPAKEQDGKFVFPAVSLKKTPESAYFFKTTLANIRFYSTEDLKFPFQSGTYTLSLREMIDYANNSVVYGGKVQADSTYKKDGLNLVFANHGIMVAKPNEPSLQRFVSQLLSDPAKNASRETRIQTLLDFVTNEIPYDFAEAFNGETLKRPSETLMSKKSDCSNKTILMASLLEQLGEDYIMIYSPQHITIGVLQVDFQSENNLWLDWDGKRYLVAETTAPGFTIGKTKVTDSMKLTTFQFVQRPKERDRIYRTDTFEPLEFR